MTRNSGDSLDVLVVEDNPGDVRLIREAFEGSDEASSVVIVTDGEEALDYLYRRREYESATVPDLVLLDLNVPKVNGRDVLERIEGDGEVDEVGSVPVVVFSGSRSPDDVRETYELGASGYFTKPVDPSEFISTVRTIEESAAGDGRVPPGEYSDLDGPE